MEATEIAPETVLLGKYRVECELGRGGMGVVVRARHETLDEVVAIKLLTEVEVSDEAFSRFMREARASAKLKSPHVVRVSDVGELDGGMPYMVMELLEGADLQQLIQTRGTLEPGLVANLIIQVCEALTDAHSHGIVHRDIKSSNLFVTTVDDAPLVKVLDFGIAKAPESADFSLTRTSSVLGTPGYMSPEQLRSPRAVDHRTDVWALGVVLYEALEGARPFDSETFAELCVKISIEPAPPMVKTPPRLAAIVMRCLDKDPAKRFERVFDLAVALVPWAADRAAAELEIDRMQRVLRSSGVIAPARERVTPPATMDGVPVRSRRSWLLAAVVLLIGGGVAAAVVLSEANPGSQPAVAPVMIDAPALPALASPRTPEDAAVVEPADAALVEPAPADAAVAEPKQPTATKRPRKPVTPPKPPRVKPPTERSNAGSATTPKPCDPYTDRHGCMEPGR